MELQKILRNEKQFLALTTLRLSEFEELLVPFSHRWYEFIKHFNFRNERRKKPLTAAQISSATKSLQSDKEKLYFILYFFKNAHLQESLAAQFDMNQGHISRWIKLLRPILEQSIIDLHLQPARTMEELVKLFRYRQEEENISTCESVESMHMDVTERGLERNLDYKAQEQEFSGKKKTHTLKNTVINDENQFVHFLGYTFVGSTHDKAMAEQELPDFKLLEQWQLWLSKDKAYQAYQPQGVHLLEPFKAARNRPLTDLQKEFNQWLSSIRIVSEHAISGIKRCRILKEKLRYFSSDFRDKICLVSAGLHNLRVTRRKNTYQLGAQRVSARIKLNFSQT